MIASLAFIILLASTFISQFFRIWIQNDKDEKFKNFVKKLEYRVSSDSSEKLALSPVELVNIFLDQFLGSGIFTRNIFKFVSLITIPLIFSSLLLLVIVQKSDTKKVLYPWKLYNISLEMSDSFYENFGSDDQNKNEKVKKYNEDIKARSKFMASLNTPLWHVVYSILYLFLISILSVIFVMISLSIIRKLVSEMKHARGSLTLLGGVVLTFVFLVVGIVISTTALTLFSIPAFWIFYDVPFMIVTTGIKASIFLFSFFLGAIMIFGLLFILSNWIKVIIIIALLPLFLLMVLLFFESIVFSLNKPIHLAASAFLRHSIEWKTGPLDFVIVFLTAITLFVNFIVHLVDLFI